jgi:predicted DNA-binding transcriptional regulator AlpA
MGESAANNQLSGTEPVCVDRSPELLRAAEASKLCGIPRSSWDKQTASGLTPMPIRLGKANRWSASELRAWMFHRCPDRKTWEAMWPKIREKLLG